jgi:hypothetical protein
MRSDELRRTQRRPFEGEIAKDRKREIEPIPIQFRHFARSAFRDRSFDAHDINRELRERRELRTKIQVANSRHSLRLNCANGLAKPMQRFRLELRLPELHSRPLA